MTTIFDLLFILNGTLGLICTFLVALSFRSNRNVNIYLAILLLAASIRLILRGYIELTDQTSLIKIFSNNELFLMGIPLPYLYFRNLILNQSIFKIKDLFHFFFPTLLIIESNSHLLGVFFHVDLNAVINSMVILILLYYNITILLILVKTLWRKKNPTEIKTEQEGLLRKWTLLLYISFNTIGIQLILNLILTGNTNLLKDNYITLIIWFIVFAMILASPSILTRYVSKISRKNKKENNPMSFFRLKPFFDITNPKDLKLSHKINIELDKYFLQIIHLIEAKDLFRQTNLTINELALKSKIPISHLNFIFKYHSEISFSDFKKVIRILDALALIEEGYLKTNTFETLSKKVGFNTYNSFYISFKEITGKAPQNFITSLNEL